jgi:hypothetical protein
LNLVIYRSNTSQPCDVYPRFNIANSVNSPYQWIKEEKHEVIPVDIEKIFDKIQRLLFL